MRKKNEEASKKRVTGTFSILPVLLGAGFSLLVLLLLVLLMAALILGGILPAATPGIILSLSAGLCAFIGGRFAIGRGEGQPMVTGTVTAGILCLVMILVCLGVRGEIAFHGQFIGTLLMILAGGAFAGLLGKKKRKKKKK